MLLYPWRLLRGCPPTPTASWDDPGTGHAPQVMVRTHLPKPTCTSRYVCTNQQYAILGCFGLTLLVSSVACILLPLPLADVPTSLGTMATLTGRRLTLPTPLWMRLTCPLLPECTGVTHAHLHIKLPTYSNIQATHTHMHMYTHTHTCICTHTHTHAYACICTHKHTQAYRPHTHTCICTHACMHAHTDTHMCTCIYRRHHDGPAV